MLHLTLGCWLLPGWQLQPGATASIARLCEVYALQLCCTLLW